jgi:tryptophanyl-tRNA synthetase
MRVLSGIQPTGQLHIGNYVGAVKYWTQLQEKHDCFFTVVDLHALTTQQDPKAFAKATVEKVVELISVGLDPQKCAIFLQSHVKQHTELAWIFNTLTPVAELERMTQYKDKSKKNKQNINAGLLTYPALMAADILLYRPQGIPVGKDQLQHLELTRIIARKFNNQYGETFEEPDALTPLEGAKLMSLQDPKRKMSKSDGPASCISLFDTPEDIKKKIMRAATDTGKEVTWSPSRKPGIANLLTIYALFAEQSVKDAEKHFHGQGYAQLKKDVAELLIDKLDPFRKKKKELEHRDLYLREILKAGAHKARSVAEQTMEDVRSKVGLVPAH